MYWSATVRMFGRGHMSNNFSHLSTFWILNYVTLTEYFTKHNTTQDKVFAFWSADLSQIHSSSSTETQRKTVPPFQASFQAQLENITKLEIRRVYCYVCLSFSPPDTYQSNKLDSTSTENWKVSLFFLQNILLNN